MPKRIDIDGNSESDTPIGFGSQWPDVAGNNILKSSLLQVVSVKLTKSFLNKE